MKTITYSKNVFLPLTNVCANACGYCSFKAPVKDECVMNKSEVEATLLRGHEFSCTEALFTFGERPERILGFSQHIKKIGYESILDYAEDMCKKALALGLLPHTNAGILDYDELARLRKVNASMGLMLETTAEVKAHEYSPGKKPEVRIEMMENAGKLKIPFTTGLLLGIGETKKDRAESLETIKDLHKRFGHIQEVIIQNFCPKDNTSMADIPGADTQTIEDTLILAREILPNDISVQIPPNLTDASKLLPYGVTDLGGVSPVTVDYINPEHPWPGLDALREIAKGFELRERLCVYPKYINQTWMDDGVLPLAKSLAQRINK